MSDLNGGVPSDPVGRLVAELREAIQAERVARADAERVVAQSRERERRLQRGLNALEGEGPGRKPGSTSKPKANNWTVSENRIGVVRNALAGADKPLSNADLVKLTNGSGETVRRALETLRERGEVRLAGTEKRGRNRYPAKVYALMPGASDGA